MINLLIDIFCCRRDNPELAALIQDYPNIDAHAIVGPYLRKNLTDYDIDTLRNRVTLEDSLRKEMGNEAYEASLERTERAFLTRFTPSDEQIGRARSHPGDELIRAGYLQNVQKADLLEREHALTDHAGYEPLDLRQAQDIGQLRFPTRLSQPKVLQEPLPRDCNEYLGRQHPFAEIAPELEKFLLARECYQKCKETLKERRLDLKTAAYEAAEIARLFYDWNANMTSFVVDLEQNKGMQKDFQWFHREVRRIQPHLHAFIGSFPGQLMNIDPPEQIVYRDAFLKPLVRDALDALNGPFCQNLPHLFYRLQAAQTQAVAKAKLLDRHKGMPAFIHSANAVLDNAVLIPVHLEAHLKNIVKSLSKSSLRLKALNALTLANETAFKTEKLRLSETRRFPNAEEFYPKEQCLLM